MNYDNLGLVIIKPPYAGNNEESLRIFNFINNKLFDKFEDLIELRYSKLIKDEGQLTERLYGYLRGKWDGLDGMLAFFKDKLFHVLVYGEHPQLPVFLKNLAGETNGEIDENTIRGMMRQIHGRPEKEYLNSVHIPQQGEILNELNILRELNIFDYENAVD